MTRAGRPQTIPIGPVVGLIGIYLFSRGLAYLAGVRFDLSPLATSWQILDPVLLKHDLLVSLYYMTGQPPLYNLMLGLILKIGGDAWVTAAVLRLLFSALAISSCIFLYVLLCRLTGKTALAFTVSAIFMLSPALILYESLPYYTVLVLWLLGLIAWLFQRLMQAPGAARATALFMAMAVLIYTRSMFQVEWFVVLAGLAVWVLPGHRRAVLAAALLPLVIILALYAKNASITGQFATSDWMGMSLAKLTTLALDHDERARMVHSGQLSPIALDDKAYDIPEAYANDLHHHRRSGIAVLDDLRKSTHAINYNYLPYAQVSAQSQRDALAVIRTHPRVYLDSLGTAWLMFWRPSSDYPFLKANRDAIEPWSRGYARLIAGQPKYPQAPGFDLVPGTVGWLIAAGYLLAVAFGLGLIGRCIRQRQVCAADATLIFLWLNVMYVSVVGNALEMDENQRFRFAIDPFIVILLATAAQRAVARLRGDNSRPLRV